MTCKVYSNWEALVEQFKSRSNTSMPGNVLISPKSVNIVTQIRTGIHH